MTTRSDTPPEAEYIEARRVLLDALTALGEHSAAIVVAGAQAVYLRAGEPVVPVSDFTTDADIALDPARLAASPKLEALLEAAGFEHVKRNGVFEPGVWQIDAVLKGPPIPLDLIVPAGAAAGGRRSTDLGPHGRRAARRSVGLEAALVDNKAMTISSLDPDDNRTARAHIAGLPALLIAKSHKISDRVEDGQRDRVSDKDASDVIRIMQAMPPAEMASELTWLSDHPQAGSSTQLGIAHFHRLFGRRGGEGIAMAVRALRQAMPEETVQALCLAYSDRVNLPRRNSSSATGRPVPLKTPRKV